MFTCTCRLSWRHLDCVATVITGSQEQLYKKFWASFPKIYRFQQARPIRKLTIQICLVYWNRKISENLAHKFHVKFFLFFCRKSFRHLCRWLNANLNGQFVIARWRITKPCYLCVYYVFLIFLINWLAVVQTSMFLISDDLSCSWYWPSDSCNFNKLFPFVSLFIVRKAGYLLQVH